MRSILFLLFFCTFLRANSMLVDTTKPGPLHRLKIEMADGTFKRGYFQYTTDSTAFFSKTFSGSGYIIPVENINAISYKRGTSFLPRVIIGSVAGFLFGFLTGINNCDDDDPYDDCSGFRRLFGRETTRGAFYQGLVFGGIGFMAGAFTGRISYEFPIERNRNQFSSFRWYTY